MPRLLLTIALLALPQTALAKSEPQVRLEVKARDTAFEGRTFGDYGPWERIAAVAHMRIDPRAAANRGIVDLALAPRAADGMVEYDVDVVILRPAPGSKQRRVMLYDVVNRGMKLLSMFSGGVPGRGDPIDPGDGLLLRQGYTLVWSGWQGDLPAATSLVGARFPVARGRGGLPVTGTVTTETIFDSPRGDRMALPYPPAGPDQPGAKLTVRARSGDPALTLSASAWRFDGEKQIVIQRPPEMDAGAIYRFEYVARDPRVMGLGFAATRDLVAWLRHAGAEAGNPLADIGGAPCERDSGGLCANPAGGVYSSAVAIGGSQSGRYLRDFLWRGFNRDLAGRKVFDGAIPFIPGARQTFTNFRFAEPGRFSRQHEDHGVPGFTFPFAYGDVKDRVTGRTGGILQACRKTGTCPRVFHIDTSAEFWQAGSSLVGTGGTGRDVDFPADVRAYMIAGGAHAPGMTLPACRYPANSLNYAPVLRALIPAMIDWSLGRREPPDSRWPRLDKGELVAVQDLRGPSAPSAGLEWAKVMNRPEPPAGGRDWPVHAPAIDADGNDRAGIRLPEVAAPAGTWLGWNLRKAGYGEGDLCLLSGSYLPFAKDAAARAGDARPSMAERYAPGERRARWLRTVEELRGAGLLLPEDAERLTNAAPGL